MDKKAKKRAKVLQERLQKLQKMLAGAKQQCDEPGEVKYLQRQIDRTRERAEDEEAVLEEASLKSLYYAVVRSDVKSGLGIDANGLQIESQPGLHLHAVSSRGLRFGSRAAVGNSFVFVIDRSKSMGGEGLGALDAAGEELTTALARLEPAHRFQVIAYHRQPVYLGQRRLLDATPEKQTGPAKHSSTNWSPTAPPSTKRRCCRPCASNRT